ncbi:MAG: sulfotransferase, partial [Planctomycetota bacterium JB042]
MPSSHPPVIVSGMHRSGTSLAASWLAALGVDLGDDLVPADERNPKGYFEERSFVELHGNLLTRATRRAELGHRDWGWTASEWLDRGVYARYDRLARALVERRRRPDRPFGFKDPRASLVLDFWDEHFEDARFVLIYRFPWEVADSMQRTGVETFLAHPEIAYPIWRFYNRQLLDFHDRHGERCALISSNALPRRPDRFAEVLRAKLGLSLDGSVEGLFDAEHFRSYPADDPLVGLAAEAYPECVDLLERLDAAADLPANGLWDPERRPVEAGHGPPRVAAVVRRVEHGASLLVETWASIERAAGGRCRIEVIDRAAPLPEVAEPYVLPLTAGDRLEEGFVDAAVAALDGDAEAAAAVGAVRRYGRVRDPSPRALESLDGAVFRTASLDRRGRP